MAARTKAQQEAVARCHSAGREYERAARSILSLDLRPRFGLLRDAATCFIAAIAVDLDPGVEVDQLEASAAWTHFDDMVERGVLGEPPPQVVAARALLAQYRPLDPAERQAAASPAMADAFAAVRWLRRRVEPRSARVVRRMRKVRSGALAVAGVLAVGVVLAVALKPTNIALGKAVTGSSIPEGSSRRPGGLTNGLSEASCGAETMEAASSWFMVDLETPTPIERVVVYNRGDGNPDDSLPLALEAGESPTTLEIIATRTERFTRTQPWTAANLHRTARYVRVRRTAPGALALDEIEIYR